LADDSYLSISTIATDAFMIERLNACATQQEYLGSIVIDEKWGDPPGGVLSWVANMRYVWASSPGWGAAWDYALAAHPDDAAYEPGQDPGVITDGMILSAVQALGAPPPEPEPAPGPTQ
jgi:hypothetical protein